MCERMRSERFIEAGTDRRVLDESVLVLKVAIGVVMLYM